MNATKPGPNNCHFLAIIVLGGLGGLVVGACTANTVINADLDGRGDVPANQAEVDACKKACAARSKCSNANASCETQCQATSSDDAVAFKKCVDKNACDPACDGQLVKPPKADGSAPDGDASGKDGSVDGADGGGDPLAACLAACKGWQLAECVGGGNQCPSYCNNATPAAREAFANCVTKSDCSTFASACWGPFVGSLPGN